MADITALNLRCVSKELSLFSCENEHCKQFFLRLYGHNENAQNESGNFNGAEEEQETIPLQT